MVVSSTQKHNHLERKLQIGKLIIKSTKSGTKFDLLATNGQVIASSQVYKRVQSCREGIDSVARNAPVAGVEDQPVIGTGVAGVHKIVSYSHIAFNAHDAESLITFYCDKLGLKRKFTLTTDGIIEFFKYQTARGTEPSEKEKGFIRFASSNPGIPMITYLEIAHHQYLELFHVRELLEEPGVLAGQYGYQHLAIQVENLKDTYDEMIRRGVEPDTEINQGPDYTWQFWLHDPEGNRIEFMEYSPLSLQL